MQTQYLKKYLSLILLTIALALSSQGQANPLTIDNFTHSQTVFDRGDSTGASTNTMTNLTGTDLANASRTFIAEATVDSFANKEEIVSGESLLKISNAAGSAGTASILWSFDPINLNTHGNAILLKVLAIDLNVNVEMVANDTSSSGVKIFGATTDFLVSFNDFTNPAVFANLRSFRLNFTGPEAWDGQFQLLTTTTPVPIPAAFSLMGSALLGFIAASRRKMTL